MCGRVCVSKLCTDELCLWVRCVGVRACVCVCVYHLNRCKTSDWFSLICRGW